MKKLCVLFANFTLLISCSGNKDSIIKIGEITFRRSYAGHEDMTQKQVDSIEKSNPEIIIYDSLKTISKLEDYGIIKDHRFDSISMNWQYADLSDNPNFKFCRVYYNQHQNCQTLQVKTRNKILNFNLKAESPVIFSTIKDSQLILVVEPYYIVNGDNYNLEIFKVQTSGNSSQAQ
jgi:hypothetical protein